MAIRKKLTTDLRVVSLHDDAVDWTRTPKLQYAETRDPDLVHLRGDEQPTWWTLRPLSPGIIGTVEGMGSANRRRAAFAFGCVDCSDATELGLVWDRHRVAPMITDQSMAGVPSKVVQELGDLVLQRESMTEGEEPRFAPSHF